MFPTSPSALITDRGQRVQLRIRGRFYEISQKDLRTLLGLAAGASGLGITIDGDRLCFEFAEDQRTVEISAAQLHSRLAKRLVTGTSSRQ